MSKKRNVRLRSDLRIQPLFSGFSMQIDHLHPSFSALRLFRKDLPYISSNMHHFDLWYSNQSNEFKIVFESMNQFSKKWSEFIDALSMQTGYSLDLLYQKIPDEIKGGVELFYTGLNKPSYKFNGLLYDNHNSKSLHSFILSDAKASPNWRYWWGTTATELEIKRPLDHISCSVLADLALNPSDFDVAHEKTSLDVDRSVLELITQSCFDDINSEDTASNLGVEINYINHATLLVKKGDVSIMIDPLLNFYDQEKEISLYDYAPQKINYVLITHAHYDHIDLPTLITLRNRIGKILLPRATGVESDFSLKNALEPYFPGKIIEIDSFDEADVGDKFTVTSLPFQGEHSELISPKATWLISVDGKNFWFGADSRAIDISLHKFIYQKYGPLEAMFVGTACQGSPLNRAYPQFSVGISEINSNSRTTEGADHQEIYEMIDALKPNSIYIYALGYEKWLRYFLGKPIQRYSDEFDMLVDFLAKKNKTFKRISLLVDPQRISL